MAPEEKMTLPRSAVSSVLADVVAHLMRIASLILNAPGFSCIPNILFPRGMNRSLAKRCPMGYVARITKYWEKEGALDLK